MAYAAALSQLVRGSEVDRGPALWSRHRHCWDTVVDVAAAGQVLEIPYARTSLPACFFSAGTGRRPLVIVHNGAYGPTSATWSAGGAAAAERGYHWMTFDGPGQQASFHRRRLLFRHDWEHVLSAVLDAMLARPDVDRTRIVAVGVGQAGYWLPRALAFEHRLAAAVLALGVVDVCTAWTDVLPGALREILRGGDSLAFDREVHAARLFHPGAAARLRACGAPYGCADAPPSRTFETVARHRLGEELTRLRTPVRIAEPEGPNPWPGQSRRLGEWIGHGIAPPTQATGPEQWLDELEPFLA